jgi:phosphoglycerate dehydrogenase-like enzyme
MRLFLTHGAHELAKERLGALAPGAEVVTLEQSGQLTPDDTQGVQVALLSADLYQWSRGSDAVKTGIARVVMTESLRFVQSGFAGLDHPLFAMLLARGVLLANAPGLHAPPIAEYVMAHLLALTKRVHEHARAQAEKQYTPFDQDELTGKTLGIVGYGGIGQATARLARAFGMRVIASKRSKVEDPLLDELLPSERLDELLEQSDVVLLAVPLTGETRGSIGAARLRRMRKGAVLVNVSRGEVIDEAALIEALRSGHLGAAVLDVQSEEPLPPSSPLWSLERCIITPHDSPRSPLTLGRTVDLFLENLGRYLRGEELLNGVLQI